MGLRDWLDTIIGRTPPPAPLPVSPAPPTEADIRTALDQVEASVREGVVPTVVSSRVATIARTVRETLPRLANVGLGSLDAYSVMATATDYLPEALGGYTRLPRQWADSRPIENGKTALMILIDQLDLLGATMDAIFDAAVRVDADALIAHGRFLQEKFGHQADGGDLNITRSSGGDPTIDTPSRPAPPPNALDLP